MSKSFLDCGYECVFGDLMFGLGVPFPIHSEKALKRLAAILLPVVGRIPFKWLYPTGEKQEKCEPSGKNIMNGAPSSLAIATISNATCLPIWMAK